MKKVPARVTRDPRVDEVTDERGMRQGIWVYLRPGWQVPGDPELHCIHAVGEDDGSGEGLGKDCVQDLLDHWPPQPCECKSCRGGKP